MRESYTSAIAVGIEAKYRKLEQEVMADIVRRIKKAGKITSTADWQLNRMLMLGKSPKDLEKLISSAVGFDDKEVERLYAEVIANEYTRYKPQYEKITGAFIPYSENYQLQQITGAIAAQTEEELKGITKSMGFMLDYGTGKLAYTPLAEIYNRYLDQAMVDLTSGMFDYNTLIRRVCKELTDSGLRTIDYASGWHNRVDVAARRAILTGASQLAGKITDMNAGRLGVDRFEVSWHVGARPDHAKWQGKVYTMKQLEEVCGLGTGAGLLGWNCRHEYYLFFPGSERLYSDKWLAEQNAKEAKKRSFRGREYNTYEATQKQRQMETNMRAQRDKVKLLQEGGADPDDIMIERCKYQARLDEYKAFSKAFNMPEQRERIYYDLKGRVAPSKNTFNKWKNGEIQREVLTEKEHRAVLDYISSKSYVLNDKMRRGEQLTEDESKMRSALTRALNKMPRYRGQLTRSLYFSDNETLEEVLEEYKVGSEFRSPQFMSTTASNELYNPGGQVQILIPNAQYGADIRRFNANEGEVLYNVGSRFKVVKRYEDSGTWYIIMAEA